MTEITFKAPEQAFEDAIRSGRLSDDKAAHNYAGRYMYMGTDGKGVDLFKHTMTREYLKTKA
jgi:hypothetical protein